MPKALRLCAGGCGTPVKSGKCADCAKQVSAARRATPQQRFYNSPAWRRVRAAFIRRYPSCWFCGAKADAVDHVDGNPLGPAGLAFENLRSLCWSCHSKRTIRDGQGSFGRWAADGKPLDS